MKIRSIILAGGEGSRLGILTAKRTKPAVPFAGKYRIIDFTLSNCVNSDIYDVMLIAQYRPHSLIEHIGAGGPWDLNRDFSGGVRIFTPFKDRQYSGWFAGTADAVLQNMEFIRHNNPDHVFILSGDHIYAMDYDPMLTFHLDHDADLTMASIRVPIADATRFGILQVTPDYRVDSFIEKPEIPQSNLVNMGVYVFKMDVLERMLQEDHTLPGSSHDFGKDVIPRMISMGLKVFAYPYSGYWVDVGTIDSYWQSHMDLLKTPPLLNLNDRSWIIHTRTEERPPVFIHEGASIINSRLSDGCIIHPGAVVMNSVLSPGVTVKSGAWVDHSVLLTDDVIEENSTVSYSVLDKRVKVCSGASVGSSSQIGEVKISTVGKNTIIPTGMVVEPGAIIDIDTIESDYPDIRRVKSDDHIQPRRLNDEL
jgi:glucose-1-phosphate adenylyltransferase